MIERPLDRAFKIRGLAFINAFIAHMTDGSKRMEDFFREIGEEIFVPQVSFFFRRATNKPIIFTVPNLHPGPMGEIGGGNLPKVLHDNFEDETLVVHGCATHDFNLVSETEIDKVIDALQKSRNDITYSSVAGRSGASHQGSVQVLYQRFGDSVLLVTTRSPQRTEDVDFSIGMTIMAEGHRWFPHVAVVDAHNCMTDLASPVLLATLTATEYQRVSLEAMDNMPHNTVVSIQDRSCASFIAVQQKAGIRGSGVTGTGYRGRRAAHCLHSHRWQQYGAGSTRGPA